ncbi:AMP-binding protein [Actinomadura fibrosa]|uniref:AMP-binding protein n=1 Tax=Actinomadura fibrosa TaxID=111802 RepID=A0ABW2XDK5_9ACTN|nr:AMP-binding protein [Actinomadura fibrosa]
MSHHTEGPRPLVLVPEDLPRVEAVPLAERDLPRSTHELLVRSAERYGDSPALHLLGEGRPWREAETWTYADLLRRTRQTANAYLDAGLVPGEPVALLLPNGGQAFAAFLAAQAVGIANPVNPMLAEDHVHDILALTGARLLVAAPASVEKARAIAKRLPGLRVLDAGELADASARQPDRLRTRYRPGPDDLAAYFHTGGTTGTPKVAPHTHANEVYTAWALGCSGGYLDDSVGLSGLPLFHVNAVHVTGLAPFMHGRPVVSLGPLGYRDRALMADFWRIIEHYRVTSFSGVPTVYASLPPVPDDVDLSSLRAGAVGAAPLPRAVRSAFEESAKVPMLEGYGLTEATCVSAATPALAPRPGTVGLRLPYQRIKAVHVDAAGAPAADCAPGETGVLAIRGPNVFPGYLRDGRPDPSGTVFDGWLVTGDLGSVDADGYVRLAGRAKDLIIRGGHNIDPGPIEESLLAHPAIGSAAVVAGPDAHSGEVPVAYVTLAPGAEADENELVAWAARHAPEPAAAPKAVRIRDALPLTAVGKVFKPELAADAVRHAVLAELAETGTAGTVEVVLRDGRPHATVLVEDDPSTLTGRLNRYSFTSTVETLG